MQPSAFLAKLLGPVFVVVGLALLLNRAGALATAAEVMRNPALLFLSGLIALTGGLAIVLVHNLWTRDWRVIVTLFGWFAAIGGTIRLVLPQLAVATAGTLAAQPVALTLAALGWLALGLVLCFFGYRR